MKRPPAKSYWRVWVTVLVFIIALTTNAWKRNLLSASVGGVLLIALGIWLGLWLADDGKPTGTDATD